MTMESSISSTPARGLDINTGASETARDALTRLNSRWRVLESFCTTPERLFFFFNFLSRLSFLGDGPEMASWVCCFRFLELEGPTAVVSVVDIVDKQSRQCAKNLVPRCFVLLRNGERHLNSSLFHVANSHTVHSPGLGSSCRFLSSVARYLEKHC
jgi:hypothetical protein